MTMQPNLSPLLLLLLTSTAHAQQPQTADSVVYRLASSSLLQVKTGKAGVFGFAGHSHVIQARAFSGEIVYYPAHPASSRLDIRVLADSLEVLTPPDTAERRKVAENMRSQVLRTGEFPEIRLASRQVEANKDGFHLIGSLTLVGQTRDVPLDVAVRIGADTLEATSTFSVKQSDFGIKPVSGGPGGAVKVADKVTFTIRAVAVRVNEKQTADQSASAPEAGHRIPDSIEISRSAPPRVHLSAGLAL
jgi:polyisoprenoid-binding protein YceI